MTPIESQLAFFLFIGLPVIFLFLMSITFWLDHQHDVYQDAVERVWDAMLTDDFEPRLAEFKRRYPQR